MDDRQVNRYLRRNLGIPAWLLVGYFILINVLVMLTVFADTFRLTIEALLEGDFAAMPDATALMNNAAGYFVAVAVFTLVLFCWKDRPFWKEKVLAQGRKMTAPLFLILLCACIGIQLLSSFWVMGLEATMNLFDKSIMETLESVSGSSDSLSMFLYASILAPISEELIFRGWIIRDMERYGRKFAIFSSAVLFGLFHGNLIQTPYAFLMGLILGYVAMEYHIGWAAALHIFNNLVLADLLSRATASLPVDIADAIHLIVFGAGALVTGVVMVFRRHQIHAWLTEEWMDRRCVKWFFLNGGTIALFLLMAGNALLLLFA